MLPIKKMRYFFHITFSPVELREKVRLDIEFGVRLTLSCISLLEFMEHSSVGVDTNQRKVILLFLNNVNSPWIKALHL